jgi:hypothetical protein
VKLAPAGPQARPRLVQLGVLTLILGGLLYWEFVPTAGAPVAESNTKAVTAQAAAPQASGPGGRGKATGNGMPSALNFVALEQVAKETESLRNPFKFYTPPPPPPPPKSAAQLAAELGAAQPRPPAPPPGPPPVPPITLKYIGKFQQGGKTVVMLTDGKVQFSASEGGIIDGRYRIVKIGLESLQIEYVNGKGLTTIPFRG